MITFKSDVNQKISGIQGFIEQVTGSSADLKALGASSIKEDGSALTISSNVQIAGDLTKDFILITKAENSLTKLTEILTTVKTSTEGESEAEISCSSILPSVQSVTTMLESGFNTDGIQNAVAEIVQALKGVKIEACADDDKTLIETLTVSVTKMTESIASVKTETKKTITKIVGEENFKEEELNIVLISDDGGISTSEEITEVSQTTEITSFTKSLDAVDNVVTAIQDALAFDSGVVSQEGSGSAGDCSSFKADLEEFESKSTEKLTDGSLQTLAVNIKRKANNSLKACSIEETNKLGEVLNSCKGMSQNLNLKVSQAKAKYEEVTGEVFDTESITVSKIEGLVLKEGEETKIAKTLQREILSFKKKEDAITKVISSITKIQAGGQNTGRG